MIDGKYSVRDVLLILSRIKMYRMERGEIMSEMPKKAKDLVSDLKIDLGILRKKERCLKPHAKNRLRNSSLKIR